MFIKKNRKKIISFCQEVDYFLDLEPIKKAIPDWYKKIKSDFDNKNFSSVGKGIKYCMPFLDSLTTGYYIPMPCDVYVEKIGENDYKFSWGDPDISVADIREQAPNITVPHPAGYSDRHYIWRTPISIKLPPGYSAIYTHPLNRFDLPFITLSGIIDFDVSIAGGNIPFFIKDGFEGLIPAGTPIIQVIPFKRESWQSKKDPKVLQESLMIRRKSIFSLSGFYKNNLWSRKSYE